jgi:hypothetical protein
MSERPQTTIEAFRELEAAWIEFAEVAILPWATAVARTLTRCLRCITR